VRTSYGLGRLGPLPRFVVFVILSIVTTFFTYNWPGLAVSGVLVIALLLAGRRYPRAGMISALVAGLLTFLGNLFIHGGGETLAALGPLAITSVSLERATLLGLRLFFMILLAVAYIAATPNYELLQTARALRVPKTGEIYLIIVLRYIDVLRYEFTTAMRAMAIRGVRWDGTLIERADALRKLPVPIIYRLMGHIHSQALAIDSRGGVKIASGTPTVPLGTTALDMEAVSVTYDLGEEPDEDDLALRDIKLTLEQGEHAVLLGRTGAGKSTLLLLALGLIPHSTGRMAGHVSLFGHDTRDLSMTQLSRIARIVFPSAVQGLIGITVEDELDLSLRAHDTVTPEARLALFRQVLDEVGLDGSFLPRETLGLSGGEMQRVALASALIARPPLLLMDEVTSQLDPIGRREVQETLRAIGRSATVLMADPNADLSAMDRLIFLEEGRITERTTHNHVTSAQLAVAGFRVPQLRRLAALLGIDQVAAGIPSAVEALSPLAAPPGSWMAASPSRAEAQPIIHETRDLTFAYAPGREALSAVNTRFHRGEFSAILGSNGSGKTTLSLIMAGALQPTRGESVSFGRDGDPIRVGYVFQEPTFQMLAGSVEEELAFGPRQLGWSDDEVQAAVHREQERFGLPGGINPINLPPAQARQLAIASVLAIRPDILILDEPTNGLDEIETHSLMKMLAGLHHEGQTIILVTHDVEVACEYAERVIVMSAGRILLDGPTAQVMAQVNLLRQGDVMPPPVVELSLALWSDSPPALTLPEFTARVGQPLPALNQFELSRPGEIKPELH
jgi:energy-coupling factor transport system ATP-binding protein